MTNNRGKHLPLALLPRGLAFRRRNRPLLRALNRYCLSYRSFGVHEVHDEIIVNQPADFTVDSF